ncbi:TPA: hypothetical protein N0F65_010578 [Lagenidium giganteum]|uniref:GAG-pre-integrase domain-containing protein n=1 Tax=Lagenidium giganteum TaxID=4803 RepID=A0AAV2ZD35_9STRA|nr:TPA: hypothetical protein N0F65_010578 [Lagenidium giganteum]
MLWYVVIKQRVLVVDGNEQEPDPPPAAFSVSEGILTAVDLLDTTDSLVQRGSVQEFHPRFGHLAYDTIERLAATATSGIDLTDRLRPLCVPCAEGKTTKQRLHTDGGGECVNADLFCKELGVSRH